MLSICHESAPPVKTISELRTEPDTKQTLREREHQQFNNDLRSWKRCRPTVSLT